VKYLVGVIALAVLLAAACKTNPPGVPADPSYASDIQPIFNDNCITCHGSTSPSGAYSLTSYAGATGNGSDAIPNVTPGSADSSKLYRKVTGIETPQMPLGRPALDTVKTATIRNWINRGAKNN
jgi:mono/diheme cytochrome c family protein